MENSGLEYFNKVRDLSNLEDTPFSVIPSTENSSRDQLVIYERNPLIVEVEKYAIIPSSKKIEKDETKPSRRTLAITNPQGAIMRVPEKMQRARLEIFLENIDSNGQLPLDILVNITNRKDYFTISPIFPQELKPPLIVGEPIPLVNLQAINSRSNIIQIPARHLPMMWLDKNYYVNVLNVRGRLNDLKE
jgi:hypothetical protein